MTIPLSCLFMSLILEDIHFVECLSIWFVQHLFRVIVSYDFCKNTIEMICPSLDHIMELMMCIYLTGDLTGVSMLMICIHLTGGLAK